MRHVLLPARVLFLAAIAACSQATATPLAEQEMQAEHGPPDVSGGGDKNIAYGAYSRGEFQTAFGEFAKLANSGDLYAQYNLAHMYEKGLGVARNCDLALHWYEVASQRGFWDASFNLGLIYDKGECAKRDLSRAAEYYSRGADQGSTKAATNLGQMYLDGEGVPKDPAMAYQYFKKSSLQGDEFAQVRLGILYGNGTGVKKDLAEAYAWFSLAAEKNAPYSKTNMEEAWRRLSPKERRAARERTAALQREIRAATR